MKFGRIAISSGRGAILAHSVKGQRVSLRKGEVISAADIAALEAAGIDVVVAAKLEADDVTENVAAVGLAERIAGAHITLERPFTGRCNLMASTAGLVCIDATAIHAINGQDEAITVATLPPLQPVVAGEMVATVKIIPFAVPRGCLDRGLQAAASPAVRIAPYRPLRIGVVSTLLPGLKGNTISKTLRVLEERLEPAGALIVEERRVPHEVDALAAALRDLGRVDMIVVFGASAITDRRDVVPVGIEEAGGTVDHLGMPVDPGNLLLLGHLALRWGVDVPVIGASGCARSPKENGFDFVLRRFLADMPVTAADLRGMGVGGLLSEIVSRPQLRRETDD